MSNPSASVSPSRYIEVRSLRALGTRFFLAWCSLITGMALPALAQTPDALVRVAQQRLADTYFTQPFKCHDGWLAGPSGVIAQLEPWAETAGLRRGDRFAQIGQTKVDGLVDWHSAMRQLPTSSEFDVHVERGTVPVRVVLPCRDHTSYLDAERVLWDAVAARKWDACITAASRVSELFGAPVSAPLQVQLECSLQKRRKPRREELMPAYYRLGSLMVDEVRFSSATERAPRRTYLIHLVAVLEQAGYTTFASDLRTRLDRAEATFAESRSPESTPATSATERSGTAFVVAPSGTLVTALHIVDGAATIAATCGANRHTMTASVLKKSSTLDLALLSVEPPEPLPFVGFAAADSSVNLGTAVFTVGYPASHLLGTDPKFTEGTVSGLSGLDGDSSFFQVSVPVQPGNSGGALVTDNGEVVGVVLATASAPAFLRATGSLPQNVNWAVKGDLARTLVPGTAAPPPVSSRDNAIKRASSASCLIVARSAR